MDTDTDDTGVEDAPRPAVGPDGWFWASDAPAQGPRIEMRRREDGGMDVRVSDDPDTTLRFSRSEWVCWVDGAERHEFDHLAALGLPDV